MNGCVPIHGGTWFIHQSGETFSVYSIFEKNATFIKITLINDESTSLSRELFHLLRLTHKNRCHMLGKGRLKIVLDVVPMG